MMIALYTWTTPNRRKISIMLEEVGLAYEVHPVNLSAGEQFKPEFLAISPNNKIPAIVDRDGPGEKPYSLFESGAILMYLAEKSGKLMPKEIGPRYEVVEWLIFRWAAWGRCSARRIISCVIRRRMSRLGANVFKRKSRGFTV
jgi:GST-like protein